MKVLSVVALFVGAFGWLVVAAYENEAGRSRRLEKWIAIGICLMCALIAATALIFERP